MAKAQNTVTPDPTEETRDAWNRIANGYDSFVTPTHIWLANEGLRRIGVTAGMKFLDVAAGSGALSIPAARLGARVTSTDLSPKMVERVQARAREAGLDLDARVMDGHALTFDDDTFDAAGSQFGVMLFPDMPRGIREMARVTRPGGKVLMTVFGAPQKVEFLGFFILAVQAVVPTFTGPPMDPPPLPFQLRDPEKLRDELARAGLHDIRVDTTVEKLEFQSGQQLWDWLTNSNPIVRDVLAGLNLTEAQVAGVQARLETMVAKRSGGTGPAILTSPINIGYGTK